MISSDTPLSKITRVIEREAKALKKLGIETAGDLLRHFPVRYGDTSDIKNIGNLERGQTAVVFGKITKLKMKKGFRSRIPMATAEVTDESGHIQCVWFNQPYLAKMIPEGAFVRIEGKVSQRKVKVQKSKFKSASQNSKIEDEISVEYEDGDAESVELSTARGLSERAEIVRDEGLAGHSQDRPGGEVRFRERVPAGLEKVATLEASTSGSLYLSNPKIEKIGKLPIGVGDSLFGEDGEAHTLYPIYAESRGVTSNWMYHVLQKIFKSGILESLEDPLPKEILEKYNLPGLRTALIWAHTPLKKEQAEVARKRFAFEEIFFIQLEKQAARREYEKNPSFSVQASSEAVEEFVKRFPFPATEAQMKAIEAIVGDMKRGKAMSRLLEGDVGSGKTAVAAAAAYAVVTSRPTGQKFGNLQVAYMCPTEILATQHFESFIQYFAYLGVNIGLITSSGCRKFPSKINPKSWTDISRAQLLKWIALGDMPILIGTHALIQKTVNFKHLALVIIDEQHRFGTRQRAELVRKNTSGRGEHMGLKKSSEPSQFRKSTLSSFDRDGEKQERPASLARRLAKTADSGSEGTYVPTAPHLLSMTATPIPRTLALTMYGDLDLTLLDQMPAGRKQVITEIITPPKREKMYERMRLELLAGRQAYVICPRIDEPDPDKELAMEAKSVKAEAKRLKKSVFPEYEIGVLHSKMKPDEKDKVMLDFKAGKINILCATSVVEVGVNVPNATCIIIEGAERFGLAQLHQLRGRVLRSEHQAYCFIFAEKAGTKTLTRLKNFTKAKNGFELAEYDLAERGTGDLSGLKQWGISDIAMDALKNLKMVEAARTEASRLLDTDSSFSRFPLIKKEMEKRKSDVVHFE
jgi:ATP-dependent DNA helicase RecG